MPPIIVRGKPICSIGRKAMFITRRVALVREKRAELERWFLFSLRHFGHLSHNSVKTRPDSVHYGLPCRTS